ncbi:MAG: DNA polymerase II large subunit [Nanoarchaeota archaeon]|nr:DNA polymerase II large subunit [Nanoarchaeota archaeon]
MNKETEKYFKDFKEKVDIVYEIANKARAKGWDPVDEVEIPIAMNMAEKVVGLISTVYPQMLDSGIAERITELEKKFGKLDPTVVFKIAEEVSDQKFCKFENLLEAIDAGIRVGFAYQTLGVVSSPIEGYTGLELGKTRKGEDYFIANFSGPIRSAGTTASSLALILIDFLREKFGFAKYDPTEEEVRRVWTELFDFHDRITNLQYMPTEEEAIFIARNMPFQVGGDPSEKMEVSNYKNLSRVPTNFLRSGFCLIMAEGLAQKAAKGFRLYNMARKNGIVGTGFDWLKEYLEIHEKSSSGKGKSQGPPTYIKDLVAGRPVYGHPGRSGSFRFRYGRGRNSGFSSAALHPATMTITDNFIATGTQLKIEKPTKGCAMVPCDEIDGPIVKLKNGSVRYLDSKEEAAKLYKDVEEIIYLGDILFPLSDVVNRNSILVKPGYVEEWWRWDLREKDLELATSDVSQIGEEKGKNINYKNVSFEQAVELSEKYKIPLYPKFIYYWTEISKEEFLGLIDWLKVSWIDGKLILPWNKKDQEKFSLGKRALELLGVPHEVTLAPLGVPENNDLEGKNIILNKEDSKAFLFNLGIDLKIFEEGRSRNFVKDFLSLDIFLNTESEGKSVLEIINKNCEFEIKDKAGEFIGARMGRPEKAKLRKLTGSPNTLFTVGNEGGRLRSVQAACEKGKVRGQFPMYFCKECQKETIYRRCEVCGNKTEKQYYFFDVKQKSSEKKLEISSRDGASYITKDIDISHYLEDAKNRLGISRAELPTLIKGIRGMFSEEKISEHLIKGVLRAKYNLQVNKDGTIRMDGTELPLVSFKPFEIGASVKKLKELGYTKDVYGKPIERDDQIIEMMPHDVLIPSSKETPDELGEEVFMKICNFIDDLLVKFYGLEPFYNVKKKEDLIGKLGVFMAPHNCAGVACRFIGFSNTLSLMASPYLHAAVRRDCDGDEAALMLLGDVLINFSMKFLPSHRGGTQDAPLVMNAKIDAGEVDDQILDFEFLWEYPHELYKLAEKGEHSSKVKFHSVKEILKKGEDPFVGSGFTHGTKDFNEGIVCSAYKTLDNMKEKVRKQMELVARLRSADTTDTARLVIERHFIRDMRGNLRKFSQQTFRCVSCNEIVRRPPLSGKCPVCRGKLIFTINEGGIKKYLEPAIELGKAYNVSPYLQQTLKLVKGYIDSIFGRETEKQSEIEEWF